MKTLTISHHIYLDEEEKKDLEADKQIEVTGISVPVWFEKGNTSEPAKEVFCKYYIEKTNVETPIKALNNGYVIKLSDIKKEKEFREHIEGTMNGDPITIIHYVFIKDVSALNEKTI